MLVASYIWNVSREPSSRGSAGSRRSDSGVLLRRKLVRASRAHLVIHCLRRKSTHPRGLGPGLRRDDEYLE